MLPNGLVYIALMILNLNINKLMLRPSYTRQLVVSNICGYFDLVSNMLPRIESCSISGNMLLGC